MIAYLRTLVDRGEYGTALQLAQEALMAPGNRIETLIGLNLVIARCSEAVRETLANLAAAEVAAKLAKDHELHDLRAEAEILKGVAYNRSGRHNDAMAALFTVLEIGPHLQRRAWWEYLAWWNLGHVYESLQRPTDQLWAFKNAWSFHWFFEDDPQKLSLRSMLINSYLNVKEFGSARRLLVEFRDDLMTGDHDEYGAFLYHADLSRLAYERRKFRLTIRLAAGALEGVKGQPVRQIVFYRRLYEANLGLGRPEDALGFALSARMAAIEAREYNREYEASEWVVDLIRTYGRDLVIGLDKRYRLQGVNLGAYLGPQAWRL